MARKPKKVQVREELVEMDFDYIDLDRAIEKLQKAKVDYANYDNLRLESKTFEHSYDDSEYTKFFLYGERLETDQELSDRIDRDKKQKEQERKRKLEQLEWLKKELGVE